MNVSNMVSTPEEEEGRKEPWRIPYGTVPKPGEITGCWFEEDKIVYIELHLGEGKVLQVYAVEGDFRNSCVCMWNHTSYDFWILCHDEEP